MYYRPTKNAFDESLHSAGGWSFDGVIVATRFHRAHLSEYGDISFDPREPREEREESGRISWVSKKNAKPYFGI